MEDSGAKRSLSPASPTVVASPDSDAESEKTIIVCEPDQPTIEPTNMEVPTIVPTTPAATVNDLIDLSPLEKDQLKTQVPCSGSLFPVPGGTDDLVTNKAWLLLMCACFFRSGRVA